MNGHFEASIINDLPFNSMDDFNRIRIMDHARNNGLSQGNRHLSWHRARQLSALRIFRHVAMNVWVSERLYHIGHNLRMTLQYA